MKMLYPILTGIVVLFLLALPTFAVLTFRRINAVGDFRHDIIEAMGDASRDDARSGRDWRWRWEAYENGPSFDDMCKVRNLLRPLTAVEWYKDTSFIEK